MSSSKIDEIKYINVLISTSFQLDSGYFLNKYKESFQSTDLRYLQKLIRFT